MVWPSKLLLFYSLVLYRKSTNPWASVPQALTGAVLRAKLPGSMESVGSLTKGSGQGYRVRGSSSSGLLEKR